MALSEDQKAQLNKELEQEMAVQKQAQANAMVEAAKNPLDIAKLKLSQKTAEAMESDEDVKQKVNTIAKDTANTAIDTLKTDNIKKTKQNYFDLHSKDVKTFGLDETSSKDQQVISHIVKRAFWFLLMASVGIIYVGAVSVIWEFFTGLTYERIEEQVVGDKKITLIRRHGFGWLGKLLGTIFSLAWIGSAVLGTIYYPFIALYVALGLLGFMVLASIFVNLKVSFKWFTNLFKKKSKVEVQKVEIVQDDDVTADIRDTEEK